MNRDRMIERLVADWVYAIRNDSDWIPVLAREGFKGFGNMTDAELKKAYDNAGLEDEDEA